MKIQKTYKYGKNTDTIILNTDINVFSGYLETNGGWTTRPWIQYPESKKIAFDDYITEKNYLLYTKRINKNIGMFLKKYDFIKLV